jgi:hypothetical protein
VSVFAPVDGEVVGRVIVHGAVRDLSVSEP